MPPLSIYKASAGSGKTFALTMEYIKLLYEQEGVHRHILAVTFTNKAAGEMKHRILSTLAALSRYREHKPMEEMKQLLEFTGLDEAAISKRAGELLELILNDYSAFSVGTIDKFFQSVIRAFTREIGIQPGYNLELDHPRILSLAVDQMFHDLGNRQELQDWLIRYAEERMEESRSWNFRQEIILLGMQLFKESFQEIFLKHSFDVLDKEHLDLFRQDLDRLEQKTRNTVSEEAGMVLKRLHSQNLSPEDFLLKSRSPAMLFVKAAGGEDIEFTEARLKALESSEKWLKKDASQSMKALTENDLIPMLNRLYRHQVLLNTLSAVRTNFYTLGILADCWEYVREYTRERNLFLIADSSRFLKGIIGANQVPFIYERTGNRYQHIMLDEFQDTSLFQYDNFRPLLDNSLAAGQMDLVVGDVKQSIYRWRNSDWKILASELENDFRHQEVKIKTLDHNYRSREQIIRFNNSVFQLSAQFLSALIEDELLISPLTRTEAEKELERFRLAYDDVVQKIPSNRSGTGGMVKVELFGDEELSFRDQVLDALPHWVEQIRQTGVEPGETAILVRTRKEGIAVANKLLEYARMTGEANKFRLISNESLLLVHNNAVLMLISLLRYLIQPGHVINKTLLKYYNYLLGNKAELDQLFAKDTEADQFLPASFNEQKELLRQLPVYELIETLIDMFALGKRIEDLPYLQALQDVVIDLQRKNPLGIRDFLEYWDQHGAKRGISVSEESNAIRILTIHKSKGLEFKAVIIPFCDWELTTDQRNAEILWCETEGTPLNRLPTVPVRFNSRMVHSLFASSYYRERMKGYMDKLNLLYVAFTRARDLLYIGIPKKEVTRVKSTGDLFLSIMKLMPAIEPSTDPLQDYLDGNVLTLGNFPAYPREEPADDRWQFRDYPVNRGKRSLRVRLRNDQYFIDEEGIFRSGRMYGNMMHQIFSRIRTEGDLEEVLDSMQDEGLIPANDRVELRAFIHKKLSNPLVKRWFSDQNKIVVFNERTILSGQGTLLRPDRVIVEDELVTVIDFKFGEMERSSYFKQLGKYMDQLRSMGYENVQGFIWYVMLDKIEKV